MSFSEISYYKLSEILLFILNKYKIFALDNSFAPQFANLFFFDGDILRQFGLLVIGSNYYSLRYCNQTDL